MARALVPVVLVGLVGLVGCRADIDLRSPVTPSPSPPPDVVVPPPAVAAQAETLLDDPLGDGTATAAVFLHQGVLWIGPSRDGTRAVQIDPVGGVVGDVTFSIVGDASLNSGNSSAGPYTSFGAEDCRPNTASCGPDNEKGAASLSSAIINGVDVLVASGAKAAGGVHELYFGALVGNVARFSFFDLGAVAGDDAKGISVVYPEADRLALGLKVRGADTPRILEVLHAPLDGVHAQLSPTCDPADGDVCDVHGSGVGAFGARDVDAISFVGGSSYVATPAGLGRFAGSLAAAAVDPAGWTSAVPSADAFSGVAADDVSSDVHAPMSTRAIAGFADVNGAVVFGRNTDAGAQLWSCGGGVCAGTDWSLVDGIATTASTRVSALVRAGSTLVVALDDPAGLRFYASGDGVTFRAVNTGALGTRLLSSTTASIGGASWLYALVADDTGPARLVRVLVEGNAGE